MDSSTLRTLEREYTLSQINWKRSLTELDMKRQKNARRERDSLEVKIIDSIANPTLGFELENFKFFGKLRRTETEIHNTLPSHETISAEKDYIRFDKLRKTQPQQVRYNSFYGSIQSEASKPRTPRSPAGVAFSGIETPTSRALSRRESRSESIANAYPTPRPSRAGSLVITGTTPLGSRTGSFLEAVPAQTQYPFGGNSGRRSSFK